MTMLIALFWRDLRRAWGSGALWLPVLFFLLVATAFPFAVGPDAPLLQRAGGGMVWVAALLAALLPIDRLVRPDRDAGVLDQLAVRGVADEVVAAVKIAAHAIGFGLPLLIALFPAAALLAQDSARVETLATGIAIAVPALASLAVLSAALTAGLKGGSAIGGLLVLPLAVPLLIFGAGMLDPSGRGAVKLLGAVSLLLTVIGPFAAGAALRGLRE
ncbi:MULTISPECIES: heme exporter protein CcmB [unclassified Sphingopyxis]|uniref:heme exporter protein CcmB n=1 Tax=unclassified Sphingopyxis TaxID=2614943 RepID=UPI0007365D65|nr:MULTISPECIES: heme exporter protein CcmB [unclassified Sphingopyxis]KTE38595.1 cytochrome C biogenesis protein CcmB [Sphingopyxis sp. HIX]KTE83906.1 cytochrome C biogenesis protein CcmB [Sphingopyxis sp. HXXIV]